MDLKLPWVPVSALPPPAFAEVRRRAIFECCKWDPQVEDVSTLSPLPIVLREGAWRELEVLAASLAAETLEAEAELLERRALHRRLGLPRAIRRALGSGPAVSNGSIRVMRFDFHFTAEGWRISEVNSDVPGGFNEASGFASLVARHFPALALAGDPAGELARAIAARTPEQGTIALVHATAYSDDRQVMAYLERRLQGLGRLALLVAPDHLRWRAGQALIDCAWRAAEADFIVRFFPAEWLPGLPGSCEWRHFFRGARTPLTNPATALLSQSKRFPLVWSEIETALPLWRRLLPETCHPADVDLTSGRWVLKPALGRVGESVGLAGVTAEKEWQQILGHARRHPEQWVAQRRFDSAPLLDGERRLYPCIGVYTVDGRAAGAYGRLATAPLIDYRAQDAAVLIEVSPPVAQFTDGTLRGL